jgi:uncharacterized RDD family membrane protein YckC
MGQVITGEAVVLDVPCARFPSRLLAIAIDVTVQLVLLVVAFAILGATAAASGVNPATAGAAGIGVIAVVIVGYPVIWETVTSGRSPGKFALGLRVVGDDGSPERFRQALVRGLAAVVEIWALAGCPALICSLLSARGKRLGDLFAGTFVIQQRLPGKRRTAQPADVAPQLAAWAAGLEMSGLHQQTAETARRFLARLPELTPAARADVAERIASAVLAQVSPPPPPGTPAPDYLAAVLAERHTREQARLMAGSPAPEPGPAQGPGPGSGMHSATPMAGHNTVAWVEEEDKYPTPPQGPAGGFVPPG